MCPRRCLALLVLLAPAARAETNWTPRVRGVGEFLLKQQTPDGCIPDRPGGLRAHEGGAMAHSLLGLARAYRQTGADRFRRGFRDGLLWLAARMETSQGEWRGSWRAAYSTKPPYLALPTPPCEGVEDSRGASATSALFVYLVSVYARSTDDDATVRKLKPYCRAALDFVLGRNRGANHLFYSAWHLEKAPARWTLDRMQFATDQAAVYLGLRAGDVLLQGNRFRQAAEKLARAAPRLLFDKSRGAFAMALDPYGKLMPPSEDEHGYFVQGYLAWVFGHNDETRDAMEWLRARLAPDGSVRAKRTDPCSIRAAVALCIGSSGTGLHANQRRQVVRWLRERALTPEGGVREVFAPNAPIRNDLSGWLLAAWLGGRPLH